MLTIEQAEQRRRWLIGWRAAIGDNGLGGYAQLVISDRRVILHDDLVPVAEELAP